MKGFQKQLRDKQPRFADSYVVFYLKYHSTVSRQAIFGVEAKIQRMVQGYQNFERHRVAIIFFRLKFILVSYD